MTKALIETAARPEAPNSWRIPYPEPIESALAQLPCPRHRGLLLLCGEAAPRPEEEAPLARAVTVAMPAGALIWVLAHLSVSGRPLLTVLANFLAPLGNLMGLDGMVLPAFHLAFPANEIMLPILAMGYLSTSAMTQVDTAQLGAILLSHGWSRQTAVCAAVLCLFHLPCGTTCLTLLKETGSKKWTLVGMLLPLSLGIFTCLLLHGAFCLF